MHASIKLLFYLLFFQICHTPYAQIPPIRVDTIPGFSPVGTSPPLPRRWPRLRMEIRRQLYDSVVEWNLYLQLTSFAKRSSPRARIIQIGRHYDPLNPNGSPDPKLFLYFTVLDVDKRVAMKVMRDVTTGPLGVPSVLEKNFRVTNFIVYNFTWDAYRWPDAVTRSKSKTLSYRPSDEYSKSIGFTSSKETSARYLSKSRTKPQTMSKSVKRYSPEKSKSITKVSKTRMRGTNERDRFSRSKSKSYEDYGFEIPEISKTIPPPPTPAPTTLPIVEPSRPVFDVIAWKHNVSEAALIRTIGTTVKLNTNAKHFVGIISRTEGGMDGRRHHLHQLSLSSDLVTVELKMSFFLCTVAQATAYIKLFQKYPTSALQPYGVIDIDYYFPTPPPAPPGTDGPVPMIGSLPEAVVFYQIFIPIIAVLFVLSVVMTVIMLRLKRDVEDTIVALQKAAEEEAERLARRRRKSSAKGKPPSNKSSPQKNKSSRGSEKNVKVSSNYNKYYGEEEDFHQVNTSPSVTNSSSSSSTRSSSGSF